MTNTFILSSDAPIRNLQAALAALQTGQYVFLPDYGLGLHVADGILLGEIVDPDGGIHRCENEYKVVVENARRAFSHHPFTALLPAMPRWRVVDCAGPSATSLWQVPG